MVRLGLLIVVFWLFAGEAAAVQLAPVGIAALSSPAVDAAAAPVVLAPPAAVIEAMTSYLGFTVATGAGQDWSAPVGETEGSSEPSGKPTKGADDNEDYCHQCPSRASDSGLRVVAILQVWATNIRPADGNSQPEPRPPRS